MCRATDHFHRSRHVDCQAAMRGKSTRSKKVAGPTTAEEEAAGAVVAAEVAAAALEQLGEITGDNDEAAAIIKMQVTEVTDVTGWTRVIHG